CMSTRSSSSNLVPPSTNPESIIRNRRRNLGDPSLLLDFEEINMVNNNITVLGLPHAASVSSASGSSTQDVAITALTKQVAALVSSMNRPINSIQNGCETYGGPHAYYECQAAGGYTQEDVYATTGTYNTGGNSY
ncbi:hypothetical protein Tco_1029918, partial [Tanacetum coccineum]